MGQDGTKQIKIKEIKKLFHFFREAPFGWVAILWSIHEEQPKICRTLISTPKESARQADRPPSQSCRATAPSGLTEHWADIRAALR